MSLWVVVGGQYGSEGKGKIAAYITQQEKIDICIRCGGPNSGHSFVASEGTVKLLRQLPTGYIRPETRLLIPAGALIDLDVLKAELEAFGLDHTRVGVDRNAMVIEPSDRRREADLKLRERLSSTLTGVGSAVARRALRGAEVRLAGKVAEDTPWVAELITHVSDEANAALDQDKKVLVEGTQGFGLSLYHSEHYPHTTSRDTSAAGFLSEVGISPLRVTEVVLVLRTFPIRVAGDQAGPLENEVTWETVQRESGYPYPVHEMTSVTKRLRRVARFDWKLATAAVNLNGPTKLAINGLDYLTYEDRGRDSANLLSDRSLAFITELHHKFGVPVCFCGTGPALKETISNPLNSDALVHGNSPVMCSD